MFIWDFSSYVLFEESSLMKSALIIPCLLLPLFGQVRINEFMASNARSVPDITDFEDYPDWIELHNPEATDVSLDGYYLSDNPDDRFKWAIPAGASIPAGGYLMVIADSQNAAPGEEFPRGYWPWKDFTVEKYHTNFSLSAEGESVVLTQALGSNTSNFITEGRSEEVNRETSCISLNCTVSKTSLK